MTKTLNRHTGEADSHLKEKGADPFECAPTSETTDRNFSTKNQPEPAFGVDPQAGWHELGKASRLTRKCKRTWRRKVGGAVQGEVLALLFLATVAGLLLAGVMR